MMKEQQPIEQLEARLTTFTKVREQRSQLYSRIGSGEVQLGSTLSNDIKIGATKSLVAGSIQRIESLIETTSSKISESQTNLREELESKTQQLEQLREYVAAGHVPAEILTKHEAEVALLRETVERQSSFSMRSEDAPTSLPSESDTQEEPAQSERDRIVLNLTERNTTLIEQDRIVLNSLNNRLGVPFTTSELKSILAGYNIKSQPGESIRYLNSLIKELTGKTDIIQKTGQTRGAKYTLTEPVELVEGIESSEVAQEITEEQPSIEAGLSKEDVESRRAEIRQNPVLESRIHALHALMDNSKISSSSLSTILGPMTEGKFAGRLLHWKQAQRALLSATNILFDRVDDPTKSLNEAEAVLLARILESAETQDGPTARRAFKDFILHHVKADPKVVDTGVPAENGESQIEAIEAEEIAHHEEKEPASEENQLHFEPKPRRKERISWVEDFKNGHSIQKAEEASYSAPSEKQTLEEGVTAVIQPQQETIPPIAGETQQKIRNIEKRVPNLHQLISGTLDRVETELKPSSTPFQVTRVFHYLTNTRIGRYEEKRYVFPEKGNKSGRNAHPFYSHADVVLMVIVEELGNGFRRKDITDMRELVVEEIARRSKEREEKQRQDNETSGK